MFSKSLTKLIDEAIVPAVLIICAKLVGLFAANYIFVTDWKVVPGSVLGFLPKISYLNYQAYYLANTYSNAIMLIVVTLGVSIVVVKAHFFHSSHISPKLAGILSRLRLSSLVSDTYGLYHQSAIWVLFLYLICSFLIVQSIFKASSPLLAIIGFVIAVNATWVLIFDIESEIKIWGKEHK
ncbi:MAG TPA: hypothetical protein VIK81_01060 [Patescibacteria group bacterium]